MNFLGHTYFSPDDREVLAGNVFGDFIKGNIDKTSFPDKIKYGIKLHRFLDFACDKCKSYILIRKLIGNDHGHYAGVIADIFIDHFLSNYWNDFSDISLESFAAKTYADIQFSEKFFRRILYGFSKS